jgi:hypothetical protein
MMKMVVGVREVPDTYGNRRLNLETGLADREAREMILDKIGERALELALRHVAATPTSRSSSCRPVLRADGAPRLLDCRITRGMVADWPAGAFDH